MQMLNTHAYMYILCITWLKMLSLLSSTVKYNQGIITNRRDEVIITRVRIGHIIP